MSGFGLQPAGTSSAGFGSPTRGASEGGVTLRDTFTGDSFGGRQINPKTGDYVLDANGRLLGMSNVQQLVQLAVMNAGPALQEIDRITDSFAQEAGAILAAAVAPIARQGFIAVVGVQDVRLATRDGLRQGQAQFAFLWRDLTTDTEQRTAI
jgi:hypothetical protein